MERKKRRRRTRRSPAASTRPPKTKATSRGRRSPPAKAAQEPSTRVLPLTGPPVGAQGYEYGFQVPEWRDSWQDEGGEQGNG